MDFDKIDELSQATRSLMESLPDGGPLDMRVLHKRVLDGSYEEWVIEYSAESDDSTRPQALGRVPAYLLIPLRTSSPAPHPAMIAFHQCFCDCDVGKDAVVGRFPYRPDQAYGVELALRGFVVLAPDIVCCGERLLPWVGKEGRFGDYIKRECMFKDQGNPLFRQQFGYDWHTKVMADAKRAVDLLQSLDFVDGERIGATGHSLGSGVTRLSMLADERIKAAILSPAGDSAEEIAALAPRFVWGLQGSYEPHAERARAAYDSARNRYDDCGASKNLTLCEMPCGHYYHERFKWKAFAALREHFGMIKHERVSLRRVLDMAVERASWVPRSQEVVHIRDSEDIEVEVDSDDLAWALFGILIGLIEKTPEGSRVDIDLRPCGNSWTIRLFVPGGNDKHRQPHEYHLSRVPFVLAEYGMQLKRSTTLEGLRYIVTNERDANKSMQATPNGAPDG